MNDENQQGPSTESTPPKAPTVVPEGYTRLFRDLDGYWAIGEDRVDLTIEEPEWWVTNLFGETRELNLLAPNGGLYVLTVLTGDILEAQLGIYDQSNVIPERTSLEDVDEVILPSQHAAWKFFTPNGHKAVL